LKTSRVVAQEVSCFLYKSQNKVVLFTPLQKNKLIVYQIVFSQCKAFLNLFTIHRNRIFCQSSSSLTIRFHKSDRKSTRLNSSHVKTSYAVFCLKKKRQRFIMGDT